MSPLRRVPERDLGSTALHSRLQPVWMVAGEQGDGGHPPPQGFRLREPPYVSELSSLLSTCPPGCSLRPTFLLTWLLHRLKP